MSKSRKQAAARQLKTPAAGTGGATGSPLLSRYAAELPEDMRSRYNNKISAISYQDPYLLTMSSAAVTTSVSYEAIIEYALNKKSAYTGSSFHSFKALESKQKFEAGMVQLVVGATVDGKSVVRGKVMHSMSVTNPCLTPWLIIDGSTILSAHCDCIAGIGEVCSHVGAILYHLTSLHHQELIASQEEVAVTDREQQWGNPNKSITENLQQPIAEIDYGYEINSTDDNLGNIPRLEVVKLRDIFHGLSKEGSQCSAMQEFCSDESNCFRCESTRIDPEYLIEGVMLDNLRDSTLDMHTIEQLHFISLQMYGRMQSSMNDALRTKIEQDTIAQSKSDLWKRMRTGRITASVVKSVCSTSIEKPAISTVKKICYPDLTYFSTQATRHGKKMEKVAFNQLRTQLVKSHKKASLRECGLFVDINHPELAASPDGLLTCECCLNVPIEIKCPFKFKNENDIFLKLTKLPQPYLQIDNQNYNIVKNHAYYAQVQMQIALTNAPYGYFYVWTKAENLLIKVERDTGYWLNMQTKSVNFFKVVIIPELLAKFYTKKYDQMQQLKSLKDFRKKKRNETNDND